MRALLGKWFAIDPTSRRAVEAARDAYRKQRDDAERRAAVAEMACAGLKRELLDALQAKGQLERALMAQTLTVFSRQHGCCVELDMDDHRH